MTLDTIIAGAVGLVVGGFGGAFFSEAGKQAASSVASRLGGRSQAARAMNQVVMTVLPKWEGYTYEVEQLEIAAMRVSISLTNHSDRLIKNVRVRMRHWSDDDVNGARMIPAIAAGATEAFTVERSLGLLDDAPFEEEDEGWETDYLFEADFDDFDGREWRLTFDPFAPIQRVARRHRGSRLLKRRV